jgi:hypothetical protein
MSFTEDELQAFNSILEQRFAAHRQEMEQVIDQRLTSFRQEAEQRFVSLHEEISKTVRQEIVHPEERVEGGLTEQLREQQNQLAHTVNQEAEQKARQVEATIDRMLAAQLLGIEQLLSRQQETSSLVQQLPQQLGAIEVQTELSWEDLAEVLGKVLDERLVTLSNTFQHSLKELEQYLAMRLRGLQDEITQSQDHRHVYNGQASSSTSVQDVLSGIEHLDRVMESMQVAMTANHALLSNRLYHHQQLPLERAHPMSRSQVTSAGEDTSLLAQAKEQIASGPGAERTVPQSEEESATGQ